MAQLSQGEWVCPTAAVGPENPHASLLLHFAGVAHYEGEDCPVDQCVPYRVQDGYNRDLVPTAHRTLVLESNRLKATFLPELGGRLWSLIHKPTGRELLYVNPVIQPANFGIRNAWFSGGIEWNVGLFGHSVFTCSPVFCGRTVAPDGSDGLRIWEYERVRGVPWQVDVWAPEDSDFLLFMPRIVNPRDATLPMYWWTCIAVTEEPGGRVLAPTDRALEPARAMGDEMAVRDLVAEPDVTYPQRRELPRDTYFDIPDGERPWIAHVSESGEGVVHVSSPFLNGRKQWVWGMERCGRRWQDWLSPGGPPYIEIQGGLAKRQTHYVPMPPRAEWSWLEAYGPVSGVEAGNWSTGVQDVRNRVESELPLQTFERWEAALRDARTSPPSEIVNLGSGWGALEVMRRHAAGESSLFPEGMRFPGSSLGEKQAPWIALLEHGAHPLRAPESAPADPCVGGDWGGRLSQFGDADWHAQLHRGLAAFADEGADEARRCWLASVEVLPNTWALRNLARLDERSGRLGEACVHQLQALELAPEDPVLVDETCRLLVQAEAFDGLASMLERLAPAVAARPRVRLARAQLALRRGDIPTVRAYFAVPCDLVDMREAETSLSDLWRGLCEADPSAGDPTRPPWEYDFRMV